MSETQAMTSAAPNPYESPRADEAANDQQQPYWGWRLVPAAVFAVLGSVCSVFGLIFAAILIYTVIESMQVPDGGWAVIVFCACINFVGITWMAAAWAFEHRRYRTAMITTVAGFVPAAIWFVALA